MSVVVTMKIPGDTEKFKQFTDSQQDNLRRISEDARGRGCKAHRFALGEGYILVIDEWENAQAFQEFFETPQIAEAMRDGGASGPPEIAIQEAIQTVDQF